MTKTKTTKRALIASVLSLLVCVSMLIGSTFAWFTDTASTGVNTIQAGKLDIAFMMKEGNNWVTAEGKTLNFTNAAGEADILWEPGATFALPTVKLVNNGNLALKFNMVVNGVYGNLELADVLDVMISVNGAEAVNAGTLSQFMADPDGAAHGVILPAGSEDTILPADTTIGASDEYTIALHMQETAGNKYQGMSLSGMTFTAMASQYTYESDSVDNKYDANAATPAAPATINAELQATVTAGAATEIKSSNSDSLVTATIPANAISNSSEVTAVALQVNTTAATAESATYNIEFVTVESGTSTDTEVTFNSAVTVQLNIGKNLTNVAVTHNGTENFTKGSSAANLTDGQFYYDEATGILYVCSDAFSPYTITFAKASALQKNNIENLVTAGYVKVATDDELKAAMTDGSKIVLSDDIDLGNITASGLTVAKGSTVVIDLNGYSITAVDAVTSGNNEVIMNNGTLTIKDSAATGKITVSATTDRSWNALSAVISNLGTVNVEGGMLQHLGGTAMAYGIDMRSVTLNNIVTNITGGKVVSDYIGIRLFSHEKNTNDLTVSGGVVSGERLSVWIQSGNANSQASVTVSGNGLLDGNFLQGHTGTNIKVNIPAANLNGEIE